MPEKELNSSIDAHWQQTGAWSAGSVLSVAPSPDFARDRLLLAATRAGVFRSCDGSASWTYSGRGLADPGAVSIAFATAQAGDQPTAFVATETGRLYESHNGGETWEEVDGWAGLGVAMALSPSPAYSTDRSLFAATDGGVFRTLDAGRSWESSTFGLLDLEVLCLVCAPTFSDSQLLWAGTAAGGLYRSRNAARAWRESGIGLPDTAIQSIVVSPNFRVDQTLFVGTETAGVYRSQDGGATWQQSGSSLSGRSVNCLHCVRQGLSASSAPALVAGTDAGVYYTLDGERWLPAQSGDFLALSIADANGEMLLASSYLDGIFSSADDGRTWQPAGQGIVAHTPPLVAKGPGRAIYALDSDGLLAYTLDSGANWRQWDTRADPPYVQAFALRDSASHGTLCVATEDGGVRILQLAQDGGIQDSGIQTIADELDRADIRSVVISPDYPTDSLILATSGQGLLLSTRDSGVTWAPLSCPWEGEDLLTVTFSPLFASDRRLIALSGSPNEQGHFQMNVWQSTDAGTTWGNLASLTTEIPSVLIDVPLGSQEEMIVLATQHRLIRLYAQREIETEAVEQHFFEQGSHITALASSPTFDSDGTLFAAIDNGIQVSFDAGTTWHVLVPALDNRPVVQLIPDTEQRSIRAITLGGGVWLVRW